MEIDITIKSIKNDEFNQDQINNIIIKNYKNYKLIGFSNFIKEYICGEELDIAFLEKLFEIKYMISDQNYFYEFGNSIELLRLFITNNNYTNYISIIRKIIYYCNYYLFDQLFNLKIYKINSDIGYDQENLILKKLFDNEEYYYFNPNYSEYDFILLCRDVFEYDDSDTMIQNTIIQGDIRIIKLFNILFSHGYIIKNNIIFYMLCWHISYILADKYITDEEHCVIFKLFENIEFKKYFVKESIEILLISLDNNTFFNMELSYILEKIEQQINSNTNVKFPKFIFL